jgi:hypothetical protein
MQVNNTGITTQRWWLLNNVKADEYFEQGVKEYSVDKQIVGQRYSVGD